MLFPLISLPGSCLEDGAQLDVAMVQPRHPPQLDVVMVQPRHPPPRAEAWDMLLQYQNLNW